MIQRFAAAPELETERTVLRPHRLADFDAYYAMGTDPVVYRFIGGKARTREESWQRFLRHEGMWSMLGFGSWAIEDKATGRFIGEAGFHDLKRDITPSIEGLPEAGWSLVSGLHGRGLATEAMRRILDWSSESLHCRRTVCIIDPQNEASLNVAAKLGYREAARTEYHGDPVILLERQG